MNQATISDTEICFKRRLKASLKCMNSGGRTLYMRTSVWQIPQQRFTGSTLTQSSTERVHPNNVNLNLSPIRSKCRFTAVLNIQKAVFVLLLFIDITHEGCIWRNGIGAKQKESFFRSEFDALANHIMELPHSQIRRHKILLLVNVWYIRTIGLFANNRNAVRILGSNALCFALSLFWCERRRETT
jgi:hypothetical protein